MRPGITPAKLWIAVGASTFLGLIRLAVERLAPGSDWVRGSEVLYQWIAATAYGFAAHYAFKIAGDHRGPSTMRTAWLLIALGGLGEVVRHSFECLAFGLGWTEIGASETNALVSLRQIPMVLALVLLLAGLIAMWSSFTAIGLGVRWRRKDALIILAVLVFISLIMPLRDSLSDAQSVYPLITHIQSANPPLIAAAAVIGLVLYRISTEMQGGQLAASLSCMVAYLMARLVAMLLNLSPNLRGVLAFDVVARVTWWSVPLLFLLAVVYRWRLTLSAIELADRYERDPHAAIAGLSQRLQEQPGDPARR
jgi:hypothetical protein